MSTNDTDLRVEVLRGELSAEIARATQARLRVVNLEREIAKLKKRLLAAGVTP